MVGISGLGRIGRVLLRILFQRRQSVILYDSNNDATVLEYLINQDTIYGQLKGHYSIFSDEVPNWESLGVKVVVDCSGKLETKAHLANGAKAVIISAPAEADATLIYGVNHLAFVPGKHKVISMASCTMNAIAPIIKIVQSEYEIKYLNLVSVNAYTNSQRLVDAPSENLRLSRAASQNIIPSESSTKNTIDKIFPNLKGKYSALAFRVPVICGSVSYLSMQLDRNPISIERLIKECSAGIMYRIVEYSSDELVSSDIIGNSHSAIIDGLLTRINGNNLHLVLWYDNEFGYASRLADLATYIHNRIEGESE